MGDFGGFRHRGVPLWSLSPTVLRLRRASLVVVATACGPRVKARSSKRSDAAMVVSYALGGSWAVGGLAQEARPDRGQGLFAFLVS